MHISAMSLYVCPCVSACARLNACVFTITESAGKLEESFYLPHLRIHFTFLMASFVHLKLLDVETTMFVRIPSTVRCFNMAR